MILAAIAISVLAYLVIDEVDRQRHERAVKRRQKNKG